MGVLAVRTQCGCCLRFARYMFDTFSRHFCGVNEGSRNNLEVVEVPTV